VTWAVFTGGGRRFALFNTHLPYRAEDEAAREQGVKLLTTRIATIAPDLPVVVTGDFNPVPDTPTWRVLNGAFHDAWLAAAKRTSPAATFHNFTGTPDRRIDWIFARGSR
jgi:endonuclease/exonuclease/phosphatase family metal-dependent hydrolase